MLKLIPVFFLFEDIKNIDINNPVYTLFKERRQTSINHIIPLSEIK